MTKSEKLLFVLVTALLALLMFAIVCRAVIGRDEERVYRISFISDDVHGDYSQNIRKGLDRAARDYNVDLQIITLHGDPTTQQQQHSLERELQSGAHAVILNLQQYPGLSTQLDLSAMSAPIVSVGSAWDGSTTARSVSTDDVAMGRMLASEMLHDGVTACKIRTSLDNARVRMRAEALIEAFAAAGIATSVERDASSAAWIDIPEGAVVAALDEPSLEKLAKGPRAGQIVLYGIGCTNELLYYMESGVIAKLIVEDDYAMGYLAVRNAVEAIEAKNGAHEQILNCYVADPMRLYEEPLQHILFPIS